MGGVGEAFRAQARVQKGTGKALGTEIAEGGFWQAFLGFFERGMFFLFHESSERASSMFLVS